MARKLLNLTLAEIRTVTRTGDRTKARGATVHIRPCSGPLASPESLARVKGARQMARRLPGSRRSGGSSLNQNRINA